MSTPLPIHRAPAGFAISGHPIAVSITVRRKDWPWWDDFAPLDATDRLPQGSHDVFDSQVLDAPYIGFTILRAGALA